MKEKTKLGQIFEISFDFMWWYYDAPEPQSDISEIIEESEKIINDHKKHEYLIRASMLAYHCKKYGFSIPFQWDELATKNFLFILNVDFKDTAEKIKNNLDFSSEINLENMFDLAKIGGFNEGFYIQQELSYHYTSPMLRAVAFCDVDIINPMNNEDFKAFIDTKFLDSIDRKTFLFSLATYLLTNGIDSFLKNRTIIFNQVIEMIENVTNAKRIQANEPTKKQKVIKFKLAGKYLGVLFRELERKKIIEFTRTGKTEFARQLYEIIEFEDNYSVDSLRDSLNIKINYPNIQPFKGLFDTQDLEND